MVVGDLMHHFGLLFLDQGSFGIISFHGVKGLSGIEDNLHAKVQADLPNSQLILLCRGVLCPSCCSGISVAFMFCLVDLKENG